jgi:ferrochelatase
MIDKIKQAQEQNGAGVLIINLGTPDSFNYRQVRRYLKEFLSDRRVIETNRAVWWFVLNFIILTSRPRRTGHGYEKIWNRETDESPLKTITRAQAKGLAEAFTGFGNVSVDWGMRYGNPPMGERLRALIEKGHDRILIAPLYPQYSASTTATALDKVFETLRAMRWQPAIRTLPPYYAEPVYISALAESIRSHIGKIGWKPDRILVSFHGLPVDYVARGDPYYQNCVETVRLLREMLDEEELVIAFQSRFGRAEWLQPYADVTAAELARKGCRNLLVVCPGFAADCIETLEEIDIGLRHTFQANGGKNFSLVPCLNASEPSIRMLSQLLKKELQGWI